MVINYHAVYAEEICFLFVFVCGNDGQTDTTYWKGRLPVFRMATGDIRSITNYL